MRRPRWQSLLVWCCLGALSACGADGLEAPPAPPVIACQPLDQGPDALLRTLSSSELDPVRELVREHLLASPVEGGTPPLLEVLRGLFKALAEFARLPPERGAPSGKLCALAPPPLSQSHPLCELRRLFGGMPSPALEPESFRSVEVGLAGLLDYLSGRSVPVVDGRAAASAVAAGCAQTAVCRLSDGLDLVIGLAAYLRTTEGERLLVALEALLQAPELRTYFADSSQPLGGEEGAVALARTLTGWVQAQPEVRSLDSLPLEQLPQPLRGRLVAVLEEMAKLFDPGRDPNVLRPLQAWLRCAAVQDRQTDLVRMGYRLGFQPDKAVDPSEVAAGIRAVREADPRRSSLLLVERVVTSLRSDEQTVDALAQSCRMLLVGPSAEGALPALADLFREGVLGTSACVAGEFFAGCRTNPAQAVAPRCIQRQ